MHTCIQKHCNYSCQRLSCTLPLIEKFPELEEIPDFVETPPFRQLMDGLEK